MRRRRDDTKSYNTVDLLDEHDQEVIIQEFKLLYNENAQKISQYLIYACFVFVFASTVLAFPYLHSLKSMLHIVYVCVTHGMAAHLARGIRFIHDDPEKGVGATGPLGILDYGGIFMALLSLLFSYLLPREESWMTTVSTLLSLGNLFTMIAVCYMRVDTYHSFLQLHDLIKAKYNHKSL